MKQLHLSECDVIFMSYDEQNADDNYAHLKSIIPYAKRIHGIKGLDNVHNKAGEISDTDFVITVDGDNICDPAFFEKCINEKCAGRPLPLHEGRGNPLGDLTFRNGHRGVEES